MASEKNERLVNLVIALLATKKFLTKAQIFRSVPGYEGSQEATDRMFERDKEELRALGIQIEMRSIDPLFEDEIGYRITPDKYKFDLGPLTSEEVTLLALATQAWKESALRDVARSTSLRLESIGVTADFSGLPLSPTISNVPDSLASILDAIEQRRIIDFKYFNQEDTPESRRVAPYGIYSQQQRWYLYCKDVERDDLRSFRLDRIDGEIKKSGKSFTMPDFSLPQRHFPAVDAIIEVRRDFAPELVNRMSEISESPSDDEWIRGTIEFKSENEAISELLRLSPNARIIEPITLVSEITKSLSILEAMYGG